VFLFGYLSRGLTKTFPFGELADWRFELNEFGFDIGCRGHRPGPRLFDLAPNAAAKSVLFKRSVLNHGFFRRQDAKVGFLWFGRGPTRFLGLVPG
jgi:hypothetical protein